MDRGFVITDERLATNLPHVYAIGDIVPGLQLAHRGFQQGIFVAEEITGLNPVVVPDVKIPRITYCDPQIASVGLTEAQATEAAAAIVETYVYNLGGNGEVRHPADQPAASRWSRVKDGPVVGFHMVGGRIGELDRRGPADRRMGGAPGGRRAVVHAHPTQNEAIGEAMLALAGKPLHAAH